MSLATETCDRCRQPIKDFSPPRATEEGQWTSGYYVVTGYWQRYANLGEETVCDNCMFTDPRYIAIYGRRQLT